MALVLSRSTNARSRARRMDTLAALVEHVHLGTRLTREERERAEAKRNRAVEG